MLPGTRFRNDPFFTQETREQCLTDGVIYLVRARVVKIFTLQPDLCTTGFPAQSFSKVQRAGPANIMRQIPIKLRLELRIVL